MGAMPLHLTKVAFGHDTLASLEERARLREAEGIGLVLTTRYLPKRHAEVIGGSLYWIIKHQLIARSTILGFGEAEGGRVSIELGRGLVLVEPRRKRAHQGWRYLEETNAPPDLDSIETDGRDEMSPKMLNELMKMGLV
jgi:hypothetical protein